MRNTGLLGARMGVCFYFIEKPHLADRKCNQAIYVYELNPETKALELLGSNTHIRLGHSVGSRGEAVAIIKSVYSDLKCDSYCITDIRVRLFQCI